MSEIGKVAILNRARELGFPAIPGAVEPGESGWTIALGGFTQTNLREVSGNLSVLEDRASEERHQQWLAEENAPAAVEARANQARIEELAEYQRWQEKRPERIEALLERIVSALEKR